VCVCVYVCVCYVCVCGTQVCYAGDFCVCAYISRAWVGSDGGDFSVCCVCLWGVGG